MKKNERAVLWSWRMLALSGLFLGGCVTYSTLKTSKAASKPKILVFPFECRNATISQKITQGFLDSLTRRVEKMDLQGFDIYLSSYAIQVSGYTPGAQTFAPSLEVDASSATPPSVLPANALASDIFTKDEVRRSLHVDAKIDYVVTGSAKEQILSDLDAGNLETAEVCSVRFTDLETGETLLESAFKQGFFEIVAPDRIGKKLAEKVNDRLAQLNQTKTGPSNRTYQPKRRRPEEIYK